MTVRAVLRDGSAVRLDPAVHGETLEEMEASLTEASLTGSAVPLAEAKLKTVEGGEVLHADVNTFMEDVDFEP